MHTEEHHIRRGPYAGYVVSAEAYRLPSGDWEAILYATPWMERLPTREPVRQQFPTHGPAYDAVLAMEKSMKEMSAGRIEEPISAA